MTRRLVEELGPFGHQALLYGEHADYRHLAAMAVLRDLLDPLDEDATVDHTDRVHPIGEPLETDCQDLEALCERLTSHDRFAHDALQAAVRCEQGHHPVPVLGRPCLENRVDGCDLVAVAHGL